MMARINGNVAGGSASRAINVDRIERDRAVSSTARLQEISGRTDRGRIDDRHVVAIVTAKIDIIGPAVRKLRSPFHQLR
jgi:hypothetical protein